MTTKLKPKHKYRAATIIFFYSTKYRTMSSTIAKYVQREVHGPTIQNYNAGPASNFSTKTIFGMNVILS